MNLPMPRLERKQTNLIKQNYTNPNIESNACIRNVLKHHIHNQQHSLKVSLYLICVFKNKSQCIIVQYYKLHALYFISVQNITEKGTKCQTENDSPFDETMY